MSLGLVAPPLLFVVGATATGKSALAVELAAACGGEVLSCDSQQVYRGMDIGTGKLTSAERRGVPHHLLDVVAPDDEMTAARFVKLADAVIADAALRRVPLIICGGTGLYVRALLLGLFEGPGADATVRAQLQAEIEAAGLPALYARLAALDPEAAARILPGDQKRVTRALEVIALTGEKMSTHWARHDHRKLAPRYAAQLLGLAPPRPALYERINQRVSQMFAAGLVDEVRALQAQGIGPTHRSQLAIGYREVQAMLSGIASLAETIDLVQRNTRHYARRQISWYRDDASIRWALGPQHVDVASLAQQLAAAAKG